MARRISMSTKVELVAAIASRYQDAGRTEKSKILNELVAVSGFHRKHAIRLLRGGDDQPSPEPKQRTRRYGEMVREALIVLWEASDRVCSKRLKPLVPVLFPPLERHGRLSIGDGLRVQLLAVSAATMDRLLSEVRIVARGGQRHRALDSAPKNKALSAVQLTSKENSGQQCACAGMTMERDTECLGQCTSVSHQGRFVYSNSTST
jgi:hypothetical protein